MTRKALMLASMIAIGIVVGNALHLTYIFAEESSNNFQTNPSNRMWLRPRNPPFLKNLTDAQEQEIRQLIQNMKDSGASREDAMNAVKSKLAEWGIELHGNRKPRSQPWTLNLTDAQKEEVQQLIRDISATGAGREEVRKAVNAKLAEWGVKAPEAPTCKWHMRNQTRVHLMLERLTEDQRSGLHQKMWSQAIRREPRRGWKHATRVTGGWEAIPERQ